MMVALLLVFLSRKVTNLYLPKNLMETIVRPFLDMRMYWERKLSIIRNLAVGRKCSGERNLLKN